MAKQIKKRASKYDKKLAVNGSFEDIIKASVSNIDVNKKQPKKAAKKK